MGFLITVFFLILLSVNYKRGVIIIASTVQFLSYIGTDIPGIKIFTVVSGYALLLYCWTSKTFRKPQESYPKTLAFASLLFAISFIVSEIFTRTSHHWGTILANIITYFCFPFLLWNCLEERRDVVLFLKSLYFLMITGLFFGGLELILRKNYALTILDSIFTLEDFAFDDERIRFGLKRCNSIFSYFTTYGVACLYSFTVFFYMKFRYRFKYKKLTLLVFTMPICAFSTGSRAIFLGLFTVILFLYFSQVYFSMAHSEDYGDGSTAELRELQWEVCLPSFMESPIVGNGRMYIWDVVSEETTILRGAESIWFSIFVDYGILGALVFVNLLLMCGICLWNVEKKLICLPISYLLVLSLSPDTGVQYNILITFTIIHVKMDCLLKTKMRNIRYGIIRRNQENLVRTD